MMRDRLGYLVIGFALGVAVCVWAMRGKEIEATAKIVSADSARAVAEAGERAAKLRVDSMLSAQKVHNAAAAKQSQLAESVTSTLGDRVVTLPLPGVSQIGGADSGRFVPLSDFLTVKNAWEAEKTRADFYEFETVPALRETRCQVPP